MTEPLQNLISDACFVFRGYNTTNLGRTSELLDHPRYRPQILARLQEAQEVASDEMGHSIDLIARVERHQETTLETFPEAVALILACEIAQIDILKEHHGIEYRDARLAAGYSLGEIAANICGGVIPFCDGLRIPISLAADCAELGKQTNMGIVFSRTGELPIEAIERTCVEITLEGAGTIAISSYLSPNTLLLLGQGETLHRFKSIRKDRFEKHVHFRNNPHRWPPLHTPIVRQRSIADRASARMQTMGGRISAPCPPIASLVTGSIGYNDYNAREILTDWTDHPQRVWNCVCDTLSSGVQVVIHVGPQPNLFPATYKRLADNIRSQQEGKTASSIGRRLVSGIAHRPWLAALLPSQASLLRAPTLQHITLEDWLIDTNPPS